MNMNIGEFGIYYSQTMASVSSVASGFAGTLWSKAPETFDGTYSEASDGYSFGVLCFELVSRTAECRMLT